MEFSEFNWDDITPIEPNDGPSPVVVIAYPEEARRLMNLFRAILRSGEKSSRVLHLCEEILQFNAANYTVWEYRRECLKELHSPLDDELDFLDRFADDNPKNYQIWYHRRAIVELMGSADRELEFTADVFSIDAKNYHCWAHRQWVVQTFDLWDNELEFVDKMLNQDIRNNSAWNYRWFLIHGRNGSCTPDVLSREILFTVQFINIAKHNESAWNYLRGLAILHPETASDIKSRCEQWLEMEMESSFLFDLLAELCLLKSDKVSLAMAMNLYKKLESGDSIRAKYWRSQLAKTENLFQSR